MKKLLALIAVLGFAAAPSRADVALGTNFSPGSPLSMAANSVSGPMLLNVVSNNALKDVMSAWNVQLQIVADAGTGGTLTFQTPATGTPTPPANYIFGSNGLGISATNSGSQLTANDFFDPGVGPGVAVPTAPGANLLQMTYHSSANASGLFGIYAVEGAANTQWSDATPATQFFRNVPNGTAKIRIGEVLVIQAVPAPTPPQLIAVAVAAFAGLKALSRRLSG